MLRLLGTWEPEHWPELASLLWLDPQWHFLPVGDRFVTSHSHSQFIFGAFEKHLLWESNHNVLLGNYLQTASEIKSLAYWIH